MKVILKRIQMSDKGTLGIMLLDEIPTFVTLELPWFNNKKNVSCIPAGTYKAIKIFSHKFQKDLYVLQDVQGRDLIELHIGNKIINTEGCILLGMNFNSEYMRSTGDYCITDSKIAFDSFMSIAPKEGFDITIKDAHNETTMPTTQI